MSDESTRVPGQQQLPGLDEDVILTCRAIAQPGVGQCGFRMSLRTAAEGKELWTVSWPTLAIQDLQLALVQAVGDSLGTVGLRRDQLEPFPDKPGEF